jgi:urease alpha subunit
LDVQKGLKVPWEHKFHKEKSCLSPISERQFSEAITINPAKILGIDDKVGSLEEGKIVNVIVCTKPLIQLSSKIETVIINGKVILKTSIQTRLRDKFEKIVKERMSKKKTI